MTQILYVLASGQWARVTRSDCWCLETKPKGSLPLCNHYPVRFQGNPPACSQNQPVRLTSLRRCIAPRAVLRRGRQPEEDSSRARTVLSPRFLYYSSLMEKKILSIVNVVVWGQVKSENVSLPIAVRVSKTRVLKLLLNMISIPDCNEYR